MTEKSFSVVIISFNGKDFLRQTLRDLSFSEPAPLEIIVVDDASTDGTAEMMQIEFPDIALLRNEKNSGTSVSRNRGAKRARGEYVIFLDNDISVENNTLATLVDFLKNHPEAGIVTARLFSEDGSQRWWNVGYDMNAFRGLVGVLLRNLRIKFSRSGVIKNVYERFELNLWDHRSVRTVDWVIEECFAMPRKVFEQVGGFDEAFFMYHEGPDLCRRVRSAGYAVYFTPEATATVHEGHVHSDTDRSAFFTRSLYRYYKKHYFYLKSNPVFFWLAQGLVIAFAKIQKNFASTKTKKLRYPRGESGETL